MSLPPNPSVSFGSVAHSAAEGLVVKPLIGVLPRIEERQHGRGLAEFMQVDVADVIVDAGGIPVVLGCTTNADAVERYLGMCDGFLVPGGLDIDPSLYGEERIPGCGPSWPARDEFERALVPAIVEANKPLLGFCRGNQALNIMCGGTLWQDLATQGDEARAAGARFVAGGATVAGDARAAGDVQAADDAQAGYIQHMVEDHHVMVHRVAVEPETLLAQILDSADLLDEAGTVAVNSVHHQAVKSVGEGLVVNCRSTDGIVEGLEMPSKFFVLSVQWHPESLWREDPRWMALFRAFVAASRFSRKMHGGA